MIEAAQIRYGYTEFGFAKVGELFDPDRLCGLRSGAQVIDLMRHCWGEPLLDETSHRGHPHILPFLENSRAQSAVDAATGIAWSRPVDGNLLHAAPRSPAVVPRPPHDPDSPVVCLWVGIEPASPLRTDRNGLTVIPGSHRGDYRPPPAGDAPDEAVAVVLPPGSGAVLHPRLWTGRTANPLARSAISLLLRFEPLPDAETRQLAQPARRQPLAS